MNLLDISRRDVVTFEQAHKPEWLVANGQVERDGAYHQGTVWGWLLAPFAEAHFRVYGDAERARSFLRPLGGHLREACVGSISEIFDGDAPHRAQGCFAQAWSVSETLRFWTELGSRSDQGK